MSRAMDRIRREAMEQYGDAPTNPTGTFVTGHGDHATMLARLAKEQR